MKNHKHPRPDKANREYETLCMEAEISVKDAIIFNYSVIELQKMADRIEETYELNY